MYSEDDLLPVSALSHLVFCERRAALVILEGLWEDNVFTAEGTLLHEQTHRDWGESRRAWRLVKGLWICSYRLGLYGRADVIEFATVDDDGDDFPASNAAKSPWQPLLIEYKRGRLRRETSFEIQLCAQAMCLEEMLGNRLETGMIYYGKTRRRLEVRLDNDLREKTVGAALRLHQLVASRETPRAVYRRKCHYCSLIDVCLPTAMSPKKSVRRYLREATAEHETIA